MQVNRKKVAALIIVLGIIIIALIIYFSFLKKPISLIPNEQLAPVISGQLPSDTATGTTTPSDMPRNYQQYDVSKEAPHQTNADDLGKVSMSFAERFGSFSNQSDYGNFTDLKILMTNNMKEWVDKYVSNLKTQPQNDGAYYGVVSDALTYEVKKFDDKAGEAEIVIGMQRRESTENINGGQSYIQNLDLSLVKENNDWLFDKAYWQK